MTYHYFYDDLLEKQAHSMYCFFRFLLIMDIGKIQEVDITQTHSSEIVVEVVTSN